MTKEDLCDFEYTDLDGVKTKTSTPITSLKTDAYGITFYDTGVSMLTTITWDRIKAFAISGMPSQELVDKSKAHQRFYSDKKAKNSFQRTV